MYFTKIFQKCLVDLFFLDNNAMQKIPIKLLKYFLNAFR